MKVNLVGLNHSPKAIQTYNKNHLGHIGLEAELFEEDPSTYKQKFNYIIASPSCTHHSRALGGKPRSKQLRSQPEIVTRWMRHHLPEYMLMENVAEAREWGPLDENDKPIKERKGEYFKAWVKELESLGYYIEDRDLVAADYGDPTSRTRMFMAASRLDMPRFVFPEPTHTKEQHRPAKEIIDFSIEGKSIFNRKRPLVNRTLDRIWSGVRKYCKEEYKPLIDALQEAHGGDNPLHTLCSEEIEKKEGSEIPLGDFVMNIAHTSSSPTSSSRSVNDPLATIVTKEELAICTPHLLHYYGGEGSEERNSSLETPLATVTAGGNRFALSEAFLLGQQSCAAPRSVETATVPTISTKGAISLTEPFLVQFYGASKTADLDKPLPTITCKDRFGLVHVFGMDIRFRMLKPHELAGAMSFDKDYVFAGSQADAVRMIGNAVAVETAAAMFGAALDARKGHKIAIAV